MLNEKDHVYCSEDMQNDLILYLVGMADQPYEEQTPEDRHVLTEIYHHIQACNLCSRGFQYLVEQFETGQGLRDEEKLFSPDQFAMFRRNESVLVREMLS